jgi:hypothetical protein
MTQARLGCAQFENQRRLAEMVLGEDAASLGGPMANSGGWLRASDETHCSITNLSITRAATSLLFCLAVDDLLGLLYK